MDSAKLGVIFVIVVMAASTAGFAIMFSDDSSGGGDEPPPIPDQPTAISYFSQDVPADVVQLFQKIRIKALTNELEIYNIDTEIFNLEGVRRVESFYEVPPEGAGVSGMVYVADITYSGEGTALDLISLIDENSQYLDIQVARIYGLVSIPETVELQNPDFNLSKNYTFDDPLIQAFLSPPTIASDEIEVYLLVTLISDEIIELAAEETTNITAAPKFVFLPNSFEITKLEPKLLLYTDFNYSYMPDEASIKQSLLNLGGVEAVSILNSSLPEPTLTVEFSDVNLSLLKPDLNTSIINLPAATALIFLDVENTLLIDFNSQHNFADFKNQISDAITLLIPSENFSVKETSGSISFDLNLSTTETLSIAEQATALLNSQNIFSKVYQQAVFDADSFTDLQTEKIYLLEEGNFLAAIQPGHSAGEIITLEIFFQGVRDKAQNINASEPSE